MPIIQRSEGVPNMELLRYAQSTILSFSRFHRCFLPVYSIFLSYIIPLAALCNGYMQELSSVCAYHGFVVYM